MRGKRPAAYSIVNRLEINLYDSCLDIWCTISTRLPALGSCGRGLNCKRRNEQKKDAFVGPRFSKIPGGWSGERLCEFLHWMEGLAVCRAVLELGSTRRSWSHDGVTVTPGHLVEQNLPDLFT